MSKFNLTSTTQVFIVNNRTDRDIQVRGKTIHYNQYVNAIEHLLIGHTTKNTAHHTPLCKLS